MSEFFGIFASSEIIIDNMANNEKKITLRMEQDIPMTIIGEIVKDLPTSGITRYKTPIGFVSALKVDDRKTDVFQIWKEESNG